MLKRYLHRVNILAFEAVNTNTERLFLDFEKFTLLCQNLRKRMHMFYILILSEQTLINAFFSGEYH